MTRYEYMNNLHKQYHLSLPVSALRQRTSHFFCIASRKHDLQLY